MHVHCTGVMIVHDTNHTKHKHKAIDDVLCMHQAHLLKLFQFYFSISIKVKHLEGQFKVPHRSWTHNSIKAAIIHDNWVMTWQACTHHMHTSHAHITCTHHMHTSHAHITCTHHMHTSHAHITCTHHMHTHHMHTSHAHITCTHHMHTSHAHITCTHHMHTSHAHTSHAHITCTHTSHAHITCTHNKIICVLARMVSRNKKSK